MRFLRRNSAAATDETEVDEAAVTVGESAVKGHTPGKGRPTPKRREAEGRKRGPVAPPPKTTREALRRARGSKEDRKELAAQRKAQRVEQRKRMADGDDRYLMPRDRGPVKAYVRDLVDSKRNLLGLFMPLAMIVFASLLSTSLLVQQYTTLFCLVMMVAMVGEAFLNGRRIVAKVRVKFPKEHVRGFTIGWYAFVRATQLRKLRVPKPRVSPGGTV